MRGAVTPCDGGAPSPPSTAGGGTAQRVVACPWHARCELQRAMTVLRPDLAPRGQGHGLLAQGASGSAHATLREALGSLGSP